MTNTTFENMKRREAKIQTMMTVAHTISYDGTCSRATVGAVLTTEDGRVFSTGYNGSPRGWAHCLDVGCDVVKDGNNREHCVRAAHAETNAIINAARAGVTTKGSILYCTHRPCHVCWKLIVNAGVSEVYYDKHYDDLKTNEFVILHQGSKLYKVSTGGQTWRDHGNTLSLQ